MRLISELINGISRVLRKLIKYINGNHISTFLLLSLLESFPVILILGLNYLEFTIL